MELRVLRYFLMVAREENITRAAELLHLTQPTLSRQLMQLEAELGVILFHRSRHRIILTDDGMLLKRRAQEIIALADKTQREFQYRDEELSGEISIGSGEYQSSLFLSQMLSSFREKHPRVRYELYSGNSDNIKERIERGTMDLGLLLEPVDISRYEFINLPVTEEWGVLVSEDSPLAQQDCITPKDLSQVPVIMSRRELVQKKLLRWFGSYADQIDISVSGNLPYNLAAMAKSGAGVMINLKLACQYDGLRYLPLSPRLETHTVLVWKKAQTCAPVMAAFLEYSKKYISGITGD